MNDPDHACNKFALDPRDIHGYTVTQMPNRRKSGVRPAVSKYPTPTVEIAMEIFPVVNRDLLDRLEKRFEEILEPYRRKILDNNGCQDYTEQK